MDVKRTRKRKDDNLSSGQISTIHELYKIGMGSRKISDTLKITRFAVCQVVSGMDLQQTRYTVLKKAITPDMENIITKLIEDSPKLTPQDIKQICSDFDEISNKAIRRQIDKSLFKIFGVKSSYDISDRIVNVGETENIKCYYDCELKTVIQEGNGNQITANHYENENILGIDSHVDNEKIHRMDCQYFSENASEVMRNSLNEELLVQELEDEVLALQNSTLESSIRSEIMKAENETLLLDIQDLQEQKFPTELQNLMQQDIKIEPVI